MELEIFVESRSYGVSFFPTLVPMLQRRNVFTFLTRGLVEDTDLSVPPCLDSANIFNLYFFFFTILETYR
jgi:hypothetical protein